MSCSKQGGSPCTAAQRDSGSRGDQCSQYLLDPGRSFLFQQLIQSSAIIYSMFFHMLSDSHFCFFFSGVQWDHERVMCFVEMLLLLLCLINCHYLN